MVRKPITKLLRIFTEKLLVIFQRFFGIPPFRFYALADGIRRVLSGGAFLGLATNLGPSVAINSGPPVAVR